MKKMFRWQGIVLLMCLLTTSLLVGCKVMDDQQREDRLKELLRDKYGEEFEVREMYVTEKVEAWCYPVDNPNLLFTISTQLDMEKIGSDEYLQVVVEKQINDELQPLVEKSFGENSFIYSDIPLGSTDGLMNYDASTINLILLRDYIKKEELSDKIYIRIIANEQNNNINMEYDFIKKMGDMYKTDELPEIILSLYYGDSVFISESQKALGEYGWHSTGTDDYVDIMSVVKEKEKIVIYYHENGDPYISENSFETQTELDLDGYKIIRMEAIK